MNNNMQIRALTINYSVFQGLKSVPLGLLLSIMSLWASAQTGPASDLLFPLICSLLFFYLYWVIYQFYRQVYGVVMPTHQQRLLAGLRDAALGGAALAAFWIDVSMKPSVSVLGFIFAGAFLTDYLWIARQAKERLLLFYPAAALLLIFLSVLPAFGVAWWNLMGIKALILAICTVAGLLFTVLGVLVHISLENMLLHSKELGYE